MYDKIEHELKCLQYEMPNPLSANMIAYLFHEFIYKYLYIYVICSRQTFFSPVISE